MVRLHRRQFVLFEIIAWGGFTLRHLDVHELAGHAFTQVRQHGLEQREALRLELVDRITLAVRAEIDDGAQMLEHHEMLAPERVERLEEDGLLDVVHAHPADIGRGLARRGIDGVNQALRLDVLTHEGVTDAADLRFSLCAARSLDADFLAI